MSDSRPIDNLELICPLLVDWVKDEVFYHVTVIRRRKDNPEMLNGSQVLDHFLLDGPDSLSRYYGRIKQICNECNARAYINLNARSFERVAFATLSKVAKLLSDGEFVAVKNAYYGSIDNSPLVGQKYWVLDIDFDVYQPVDSVQFELDNFIGCVRDLVSQFSNVFVRLPTRNGVHLITKPFDRSRLEFLFQSYKSMRNLDVVKPNSPTILYML